MAWIKRNLFFVIGSIIALGLMGVGGYYLWTQVSDEQSVLDQIKSQYTELSRLTDLNPHPGDDKIDNVKNAKAQTAALKAYIAKAANYFQRIPPIPQSNGTNKLTDRDFASALRITVSQLQHTAEEQSVLLPPDYYFTFEAQKKLMTFDPASLDPLAMHLGEIKAISEILFDAKINSLDGIRREIVSVNNDNNPSDYLPQKTVSTPLADLTPYEVTFRCFSTELALVLGSFASSSNAIIVKTINIEPAAEPEDATGGATGTQSPTQPMRSPPIMPRNYRNGPGMREGYPPQAAAPMLAPTTRHPEVFLNEKPFRVTMLIEVVKLKPIVK